MLVERFDIFQHNNIISMNQIIKKFQVTCQAVARLSYSKDTTVSIREPTLLAASLADLGGIQSAKGPPFC